MGARLAVIGERFGHLFCCESSCDSFQSIPYLLQHVASGRSGINDLLLELSPKQCFGRVVLVRETTRLKPMSIPQSS